jgi:hypothetical protein
MEVAAPLYPTYSLTHTENKYQARYFAGAVVSRRRDVLVLVWILVIGILATISFTGDEAVRAGNWYLRLNAVCGGYRRPPRRLDVAEHSPIHCIDNATGQTRKPTAWDRNWLFTISVDKGLVSGDPSAAGIAFSLWRSWFYQHHGWKLNSSVVVVSLLLGANFHFFSASNVASTNNG